MNKVLVFILLIFLSNCEKKNTNKITTIETSENIYNFGEITLKDTIRCKFTITNKSNTNLEILNIATSCGCTQVGETKTSIPYGEKAEINIEFIPKENQLGTTINNSVIVETNTIPPYTVFRIKGKVLD